MKKRFNTLNEEIKRMKSLFTEERLFGNLVGTEGEKYKTEGSLKNGSKGEGVKALQTLLGVKPVDGKFGPNTKKALEKFQKENNLTPDGIAGPKTLEAFNKKAGLVNESGPITTHGMMDAIKTINKVIANKTVDVESLSKSIGIKPNPTDGNKKSTGDGDATLDNPFAQKGDLKSQLEKKNKEDKDDGKTSSTKVTKGEDGTETTVTKGEDGKTSSTKVTKGSDSGKDSETGTYDDQKGEDDDGPKKAGTNRQGTEFYQKGKRKNTVKSVLASVKRDKGEINDNVKACKKGMKEIYKQTTKIGNAEMNLTDEELKGLDWCVSTFKNRFGKLGIGIGMEEMEQTYDLLNREIPELESSVEGETYEVKDSGGLTVAKLKMVGPGKYKFNGRKGYTIASKNRKSGRMQINNDFKEYFLKTLQKDPNTYKVVTLHKKTGKNNGFFAIRKK